MNNFEDNKCFYKFSFSLEVGHSFCSLWAADFEYDGISGLSREITLKLKTVRPETLAQASRIPGVTPAAVQLLMITIRKNNMAKKSA